MSIVPIALRIYPSNFNSFVTLFLIVYAYNNALRYYSDELLPTEDDSYQQHLSNLSEPTEEDSTGMPRPALPPKPIWGCVCGQAFAPEFEEFELDLRVHGSLACLVRITTGHQKADHALLLHGSCMRPRTPTRTLWL